MCYIILECFFESEVAVGAQEETEDVLRELHILFSKAEPISSSGRKVIMDKAEVMELFKQLNDCIVKMMDEHEVSKAGRDRAKREQKRQMAHVVKETKSESEDIYAAAMMYTDHAIDEVMDIISDQEDRLDDIYDRMRKKLKKEKETLKKNKSDLKVSLMNMKDTEKYMKIIEDENARIAKAKAKGEADGPSEQNPYADIKPEIKINPAYFEAIGKPLEGGEV